jgi:hypothetical protein
MNVHRLLTVTALLLVLPASAVVAQDESPAPDPLVMLADSDFAGIFPAELGGLPWDEIAIAVGQENFEDQDEEGLAQWDALLAVLDASIDDVTAVSASRVNEDFTEFTLLVAFRVAGVEADRLLEETLRVFFADFSDNPRQESGQVAGRDVLLLYDDDSPDSEPIHFYASGDTLWYVIAAEPDLTEAIEKLP